MLENIELVLAKENDFIFGYALYKLIQKEYFENLNREWDENNFQEDYKQRLNNIENNYLIKYSGINICWLEYNEEENLINIRQLNIYPEYQRKGIGSKIVNNIIKNGKEKNKIICLSVLINNKIANDFFIKLGFEIFDTTCYYNIYEYYI